MNMISCSTTTTSLQYNTSLPRIDCGVSEQWQKGDGDMKENGWNTTIQVRWENGSWERMK